MYDCVLRIETFQEQYNKLSDTKILIIVGTFFVYLANQKAIKIDIDIFTHSSKRIRDILSVEEDV